MRVQKPLADGTPHRQPYDYLLHFLPAQFSLRAQPAQAPFWPQPLQPAQPPPFFSCQTASAATAATAARVRIVAAIQTAAFLLAFFGRLGLRTSMNTTSAVIPQAMPVDTEKCPVVNSSPKW